MTVGLLWWFSGKEFACQCRGQSFNPGSRKIPHFVQQLSPWPQLLSLCSRAHEQQIWSPRATTTQAHFSAKKRNHRTEKLEHHSYRPAPSLTARESLPACSSEDSEQPQINNLFKKGNYHYYYFSYKIFKYFFL